ncbi:MAG: hypothetical protein AAB792_01975, partial [Patescibacteria group bacterium]
GYVPVALAGRVPVKVSIENGLISVGDFLTVSSTPGVAMKATKAGRVIGQALEPYSDSETEIGSVITFVNVGFYNGPNLESVIAGGLELTSVESGALAKALISQFNQQQVASGSLSDILADRVAAGIEIISPKVYTKDLFVDSINTLSGGGLAVNLSADGLFAIKDSQNSTVVSFDSSGNASISGRFTAASINAKEIAGLDIITDSVSMLSAKVAGLESLKDTITFQNINALANLVSFGTFTASGSAEFKNGATFGGGVSVDGQLSVLGSSSFGLLTADKIIAAGIESPELTALASNSFALASISAGLDSRLSALENDKEFQLSTMLELAGGLSVNGATVLNGGLFVNSVGKAGDAMAILSDVIFFGRPYFNSDTAGFALIKKGAKSADVAFEREYLEQPIVNANISVEASDSLSEEEIFANNIQYLVTKKTAKGFTIVLNKSAPDDVRFSWIALAVKNPKIFSSAEVTETLPLPIPSPTPGVGATGSSILDLPASSSDEGQIGTTPIPSEPASSSASPELTPTP